jgi:hypothetical protein
MIDLEVALIKVDTLKLLLKQTKKYSNTEAIKVGIEVEEFELQSK